MNFFYGQWSIYVPHTSNIQTLQTKL